MYNSGEYKHWRDSVYYRDGHSCRLCGSGGVINAHHIIRKVDYPHLIFDITNGITLCVTCHRIVTGHEPLFAGLFHSMIIGSLTLEEVSRFFALLDKNYRKIVKKFKDENKWNLIPHQMVKEARNSKIRSKKNSS